MACCSSGGNQSNKIYGNAQFALSFNNERKIAKHGLVSLEEQLSNVIPYPKELSPFYRMTPFESRPIRFAASGVASEKVIPAQTIPALFKLAVEKHGNDPALKIERDELPKHEPILKDGSYSVPASPPLNLWNTWTYNQYFQETKQVAKSLLQLGLKKFDGVNIFGFNSPEWFMAQLSCILAGGLAAGIYPTDSEENLEYKIKFSNSIAIFVEDSSKMTKVVNIVDKVPSLKAVITYAPSYKHTSDTIERKDGADPVRVYTWEEFKKVGESFDEKILEERMSSQYPGDACTLVFTSGTTGNPKAVMATHDNLIYEASVLQQILPWVGTSGQQRIISYLPLSHIAGLMVDCISPICISAKNTSGYCTSHFARPYDLKIGTFGERLRAVKPTLFLGVPRVWEKMRDKIMAVGAQTQGLKKKIADWAKAKSTEYEMNCQIGGSGVKPSHYDLAQKLVLNKVRAALGLEFCRFAFTSAAPIDKKTLEFFGKIGINVNELYGMSECCGCSTFSTDNNHLWGSVGWTYPGTECAVFQVDPSDINKKIPVPEAIDIFNPKEEEQGEICYRGRHIMLGYMCNPSLGYDEVLAIQKKNEETIDADGWLHSGDKGCFGRNKMFRITGRYKELIIGAGGENIAPVPIEDALKANCPAISNVVMIGDKRPFNIALITLKAEGATGELPGTKNLAGPALQVSNAKTTLEAIKDPAWAAYIQKGIDQINGNGAICPNNASKIQKFTILPEDLSIVGTEIGPTMKLIRPNVMKKYSALIDAVYSSSEGYFPFSETAMVAEESKASN